MKEKYNIHFLSIHVIGWICLFSIQTLLSYLEFQTIHLKQFIPFIQAPVVFYVNYYILVPRLLFKKKVFLYILSAIAALVILNVTFDFLSITNPMHRVEDFENNIVQLPRGRGPHVLLPVLISISFFLLGGIIRVILNYYETTRIFKEKEVQRIETEIQYLKSQINPHFLFNSLNSIYSLVYSKSDKAADAVLLLSSLMRYMLYEANRELVSLSKEITYISDYVDLQKLRLPTSEKVNLSISDTSNGKKIYPLLLISFVENAFKYGVNKESITDIKISINASKNKLIFSVVNVIGVKKNVLKEHSGIGLRNIKDRLELLYKNQYILDIAEDNQHFSVYLSIEL